jgi:ribosomal silencing factor RsfS
MSVEIKELVIRAVIHEGKSTAQTNAAAGNVEKKLLKVIREFAKKNKKNER